MRPEGRGVGGPVSQPHHDEGELLALGQVGLHLRRCEVHPGRVVEGRRGHHLVGVERDPGHGEDLSAPVLDGDVPVLAGLGVPSFEPVERERVARDEVEGVGHGPVDGDLGLRLGIGIPSLEDLRAVDRRAHPVVDAAEGEELQALLGREELL